MSYKETDIMHETKNYFVIRVIKGYEVYKTGITHAVRCAQIGFKGKVGLEKAIAECDRRKELN